MKLSVALCTYNGAKFIRKQIESIINQELNVDEIVVCDDGSKDDTINIVNEIIRNTTINIRFYQNEQNLGFVQNFAKAISLCRGDIIFLSDQDDIWLKNKTKDIVGTFESHPEIDLISTDADLIDENDKIFTNESLWNVTHLDCYDYFKKRNLLPEFFAVTGRVTGATVAFRNKKPYNEFLNYQGHFGFHDETITFLSISAGRYLPINNKLIKYRISATQSCGLGREWFDRDIKIPFEFASRFNSLPLNENWKKRIGFITERMDYKRHPLRILGNISRYKDCYGVLYRDFVFSDIRRSLQGIMHVLHLSRTGEWYGSRPSVYDSNINH